MAELPAQHEALRQAMAALTTEKTISVFQAADGVMSVLARIWGVRPAKGCEVCFYSPDVVRYRLRTWEELQAAADGVSASGGQRVNGGMRDRDQLIAIKADIEMATDKAFTNGRYLAWDAVRRIYRRQGRSAYWYSRRLELTQWIQAGHTVTPKPEPPRAEAEGYCIELISQELGWQPHECEAA
jgi:hypothetical protein